MAFTDARVVSSESALRTLSDPDLLVLIAFGDLDALGVVYDRHVEATWRIALHFSHDAAAAEEAVSNVFVRLWSEAEDADQTSLSAWLRSSVVLAARALQPPEGENMTVDEARPEQAIMAAVNGVIDDLHRSLGMEESEFFCECGQSRCRSRIKLSRSQYADRREQSRPILADTHAARDTAGESEPRTTGFSERVRPLRAVARTSDS